MKTAKVYTKLTTPISFTSMQVYPLEEI